MHAIRFPSAALTLAALTTLVGCSGGGTTDPQLGGDVGGLFLVTRSDPGDRAEIFLNDPITLDFSSRIDMASADLNTVSFQAFDLAGNPLQEQVTGMFEMGTAAGDTDPGRRLIFKPTFATNDTYDNGGFRPGRRYVVALAAGTALNGTVLTDVRGRGLDRPFSFEFTTPDSNQLSELFRDPRIGGPRLDRLEVSPRDENDLVGLNGPGDVGVEVRLTFDQPLDPSSANLPLGISSDPLVRENQQPGRIFMRYDDPEFGNGIWVGATVDLESNRNEGAVVVLRPIGVLPNNAEIEIVVDPELRDLAGQSNRGNPSYREIVATFRTRADFEPQFDAVVEDFTDTEFIDLDAPFLEPRADVADGVVRATFEFEGEQTPLDYEPTDREVLLNTSFTQVRPVGSPPINVFGGVFKFNNVRIPQGVQVIGTGPNPMTWLVNGDFDVQGTLQVNGGQGQAVNSLQSPNIATAGGVGTASGGNGGQGSPMTTDRSIRGEFGFGAFQVPNGGGEGGRLGCTGSSRCGSGGGGGSFATEGDPWYPPTGAQWDEVFGVGGGNGTCSRNTPGGDPGPRPFTDGRPENNFWGTGVNIFRQVRIEGELLQPQGGQGGGGGGDQSSNTCGSNPNNFILDRKGGGGGGGAGAIVIKALGRIIIGPNGRITANGGDGGGGESAGSNIDGGGGGAGAGGMIVLISGVGIDIYRGRNAQGSLQTYSNRSFDFALSADGGVCRQSDYQGTPIPGKYTNGRTGVASWGSKEIGGQGGMGLIQLMTPPGDDADGTGNRLDDNIRFFNADGSLNTDTADRRMLLGWRGWPINATTGEDDLGNQYDLTSNNRMDGCMRPYPVMLPATFGALSRARSKWLDLGAAVRRPFAPGTAGSEVRAVEADPSEVPGPDFFFAGVRDEAVAQGYVDFNAGGGQVEPTVIASAQVSTASSDRTYEGEPAYAIDFPAGTLAGIDDDRYRGYRLELVDGGGLVAATYRILGHRGDTVFFAIDDLLPSAFAEARVTDRFFQVLTDDQPGLGETYQFDPLLPDRSPVANVRFGFAFLDDAGNRYPADPGVFEFDLDIDGNPALRDFLRNNRPQFVKWDVLFNRAFAPVGDLAIRQGARLSTELPFQEVDYLVLPFRY